MNNIILDINIPKKRGRKPKLKNDKELCEIKVPKKRGRKPKNNIITDVKIPKKRGRKPNLLNIKTPILNISNDKLIKSDNILHLKINTKDINEYILGDDIYKYNPNINDPIPYENIDTLSGNLNYGSLNTDLLENTENKKKENIQKTVNKSVEEPVSEIIKDNVNEPKIQDNKNYTNSNKIKKKYKTDNVFL